MCWDCGRFYANDERRTEVGAPLVVHSAFGPLIVLSAKAWDNSHYSATHDRMAYRLGNGVDLVVVEGHIVLDLLSRAGRSAVGPRSVAGPLAVDVQVEIVRDALPMAGRVTVVLDEELGGDGFGGKVVVPLNDDCPVALGNNLAVSVTFALGTCSLLRL